MNPHTITIAPCVNGTVTVPHERAVKNAEVILTVKTATGCRLQSLTVTDADNNPVALTDYTFTMPDSNVTVTATFISEWEELQNVISDAESGSVIDVSDFDHDGDGQIICPENCGALSIEDNLTLDLHGCALDRHLTSAKDSGYVIVILSGSLTVTDSPSDQAHTLTILGEEVTVEGGVITGGYTTSGGGVYISSMQAALTMDGGAICGNTSYHGGGVNNKGTFIMNGGVICGNTSDYGGGVYTSNAFTMNGGSICGNTALHDGGGVFNAVISTFTMSGSASVTGNTAKTTGGGVRNGGTFRISDSAKVTGNMVGEADDNVNLYDNVKITINGKLTGDARIGVTMKTPGVFTSGLSDKGTAANFFSDDGILVLVPDDSSELKLVRGHSPTIIEAENGKVEASPRAVLLGEPITLIVTPDPGYALESLTVTDELDNAIEMIDDYSFIMPDGEVFVTASFKQVSPVFAGYRLRLSGILGLRYFMSMPKGFDDDGAKMTFTIEGATQTVTQYTEETLSGTTYRVYECGVHAYQMAADIEAVFSYGTEESVTNVYSVKEYLDDIKEGDYSGNAKNLVDATRAYGHYIQPYLHDVNGTTHAAMDYDGSAVDVDAAQNGAKDYALKCSIDKDHVASTQYHLTVSASTSLNVEIALKDGVTGDVSVTLDDVSYRPSVSGNTYKIVLPHIAANNLGDKHSLTLQVGGNEVFSTDKLSAIAHVNTVLTYSKDQNEKNAMAALYHYYQAADAYADNPNE